MLGALNEATLTALAGLLGQPMATSAGTQTVSGNGTLPNEWGHVPDEKHVVLSNLEMCDGLRIHDAFNPDNYRPDACSCTDTLENIALCVALRYTRDGRYRATDGRIYLTF